ncbi:unnamed protein product [Rotaria magnacalcarata]|uniref:Uncharacterized protein n=2 Tax=Rotaria magnacalcarata TaxID=392030 RepID=A0A815R9C7_9BILA|nr:unnamed protein product [Rotaria magnacalcarata]CAF2053101.1 unnamed protein product [Rotaria magnacalcarata]
MLVLEGHMPVHFEGVRFLLSAFTNIEMIEEPYMFIYVFCQNIEYQLDWALEYRDYIQIFNFEADLLARMMRDIGDYFLTESKRLLNKSPPNNPAAQHRLTWANEFFQRYSQIAKKINENGT